MIILVTHVSWFIWAGLVQETNMKFKPFKQEFKDINQFI